MHYTQLGTTGRKVSRIGLGLAALGRPGYINLGHGDDVAGRSAPTALAAHCADVLDLAWAAGVRYIDAARSYGQAEAFLGAWLRRTGHRPVVGSKWGYTYTADWRVDAAQHEVKDHSLAVLLRQWRESQAQLGPWLGLYQIHSATLESGVLADAAVLDELARIKAGGTAIGLSLSGPQQAATLTRALAIRIDGVRLFDTVQATWNLLEPSCGPALAAAAGEGVGVLVKEALANGRLTERNREPAFAAKRALLLAEVRRLVGDRVGDREDGSRAGQGAGPAAVGLDALAIAAVLAQPWAGVVLSGAATGAQLRSNLAALDLRWDDQAAAAVAELAEPAASYWAKRSALAWN